MLLMSRFQTSHSPYVNPSGPPSNQEEIRSQGWDQMWHSNCLLPREGFYLCKPPPLWVRLPVVQVLTWSFLFPSYQISPGSFLQPCLYRSLPASLQLVSSDEFSMFICLLDMLMGGSNFHVLLLCHPDLSIYLMLHVNISQ